MKKKFNYITVEKAHQILTNTLKNKPRTELLPVQETFDRFLAEDVKSDINIPDSDISHFDGYAVKSNDTTKACTSKPVLLKVIGKIQLGVEHTYKINSGETVYISTGCRLPHGANAVIPIEMVKVKKELIETRHQIKPFDYVTPAGIDVKKGETVFNRGHKIRAQDMKLLIEMKKWKVRVFRKPIIAIISVGSELTERLEEADVKRFNSHSLMMSAFIKKVGVIPLNLGIAVDEINDIKKLLLGGLKAADIILTLGGCSVGEKDFVPEAVNSLGKPGLIIRGIKVQPGRVTSMGVIHGKPILMLPGHVQSMLAGSFMLLFPLIKFLCGLPLSIPNPTFNAKAQGRFVVKEFLSFKRIRFVNVSIKDGNFVVEPIFGDSSLTSVLKKADGFIIIDEGKTTIENGEYVNVYTLPCFFSHNH